MIPSRSQNCTYNTNTYCPAVRYTGFHYIPWGRSTSLQTENLLNAASKSKFIHTSAFALSRDPCRSTILATLKANQKRKDHFPRSQLPSRDMAGSTRLFVFLKDFYKYITVTKPSLDDSIRIFGPDLEPIQYLEEFLNLGPEIVVLTLGREGSILGTMKENESTFILIRFQLWMLPGQVMHSGQEYWQGYAKDFRLSRCPFGSSGCRI